jgi:hypothetical protein
MSDSSYCCENTLSILINSKLLPITQVTLFQPFVEPIRNEALAATACPDILPK